MHRCLEIVIYVVKAGKEDAFRASLKRVREEMGQLPGFVSAETFRSLDEERTFIDIWTWNSIENAKVAHTRFRSLSSADPFMETIESVRHSGHYSAAGR